MNHPEIKTYWQNHIGGSWTDAQAGGRIAVENPATGETIAEAVEEAGVPPGVVNLVCGYGHDCGAAMVSHADIDHIVFTGSVLAVLPFDEPEEALQIANGTDFGLCAGVYTRDLEKAHWTADRLVAGQVFVNEWFAGGIETPFGGMKRSGFGREKGQEALQTYVQTKNIAVKLGGGAGGRPGG